MKVTQRLEETPLAERRPTPVAALEPILSGGERGAEVFTLNHKPPRPRPRNQGNATLSVMHSEAVRVLVVASDAALRDEFRRLLKTTGYLVEEASTAAHAEEMASRCPYDLALLDFGLPASGTAAVFRDLRACSPKIGIVAVQAGGTSEDEARALEAGADDYVAAPFRFREIVARLGAVRRRAQSEANPTNDDGVLRAGSLELDVNRRLFRRGRGIVHLSPKEFALLVFFMRNQGVVLTHAKLLHAVWSTDSGRQRQDLRLYIQALRKKIEKDPANPKYLITEPWVGYVFREPGSAQPSQ